MKLLILHRIPYHKIDYAKGIDHDVHDVTYVGRREILNTIPNHLRCQKIERKGLQSASAEIIEIIPRSTKFDRIISLSEYELLEAAILRKHFGVEGPSLENVLLVRDKILMKQAVQNAGIDVPKSLSCSALEMELPDWNGRTVIKPRRGASSENITITQTTEQAIAIVKSNPHQMVDYEVEEFVAGPILHFDGLVQDSNIIALGGSKYFGTCLEYANGRPLGSVQLEDSKVQSFYPFVGKTLEALRHTDGAFHLEVIDSERGPVFLELGARVGGADVVEVFENAYGIHLPSEELKILIGKKSEVKAVSKSQRFGWFVFPGHHYEERFCRVFNSERFAVMPEVIKWKEIGPKQLLPRNISYQAHEVPVAGILQAPSHLELWNLMESIFNEVKVFGVEELEFEESVNF